jgi:capsular exopolysaccharide synthesis family protein
LRVDFLYYSGMLWRQRYLVLVAAVVGLGLGVLVGYLQVPIYEATAVIQIDPPPPAAMTVADALGAGTLILNTDFYNTQLQILRSRGLAERVVGRLKKTYPARFQGTADAPGFLLSRVNIEPIADSRLVNLHVSGPDPGEAALWANTVADVYEEQSLSTRIDAAKRAYDWLQDRLASTKQNMQDAQARLLKSYQNQDLFVPEGSVSAVTTSITKLNEDFIAAQSRRIALEAALNQGMEMRARKESLDSLPQVATDAMTLSLNGQLDTLNVELSKLKEKFKEAHPEVQKVQAEIEQVKKAKVTRANQILDGMRAEYVQTQKREAELKLAIDDQKAQAATQSRKATELEAVKKEADSAKSLYEVLLQKLNETDLAASIRNNNVTIVDRAIKPSSPVRPDKRKLAGIAFVLGLLLGGGLVLAKDYFDNTIKDPEEVERFLHAELLAAVPKHDPGETHLVTEAYQNLRTSLIFARKDDGGQVVLIAGSAPQEGKTTTLINLAKLLASGGERVLALDLDLRRAAVHSRLGTGREPGFTDFFTRHENLEALIRPSRIPNLFVLTAGPLPPNPPAILTRKDLGDFFTKLRQRFDWILVDSPPMASVTDGFLIARHADCALMVVRHNTVDKKVVRRSLQSLGRANGNVLGVVLNAVDMKSRSHYYYYYHQDSEVEVGPRSAAASKG